MGMISEMNAEFQAKAYEKMILSYIDGQYQGHKSVRDFIQQHIVDKYYLECAESFERAKVNPVILKEFPKKPLVVPSPIIDFYTGEGTDHKGRNFWTILQFPNSEFEKCHDFIQWLFPLHEQSRMTLAPIPIMTKEDSELLTSSHESQHRMYMAQKRFKLFLLQTGSDNWCTPNNHNLLRITRAIRSMRLFGINKEALEFYMTMCEIAAEYKINKITINYWERALKDPLFSTLY